MYSGSQYPIFLLLGTVHVLQPVEPEERYDNKGDIFTTSGLCQAHTPCPLGSDRDRFLRLVRDIRERKDDYAAQLSTLALASLSTKKSSIDDTHRGIITSLLGSHAPTAPAKEDVHGEQLWQARLVLKIGEILDREEEEVAVHMALLDDQQEDIFKALQGEMDEDGEESLLDELRQVRENLPRRAVGTVRNRLTAWSRLYLEENSELPQMWLTHMPEAADILLEKYENDMRAPARILGTLALPANIGWSAAEAIALIEQFRKENGALLEEVQRQLAAPDRQALAHLSERWSKALEIAFPQEQYGRTLLNVYDLTELPCGKLLGKQTETGNLLGVVSWAE